MELPDHMSWWKERRNSNQAWKQRPVNPAWAGAGKKWALQVTFSPRVRQPGLSETLPQQPNQRNPLSFHSTNIMETLKCILAWKKQLQFWGEGAFIPIIPDTWRNTFPFLKHRLAEHFHPPGYGRQREKEEDSAAFIKCALPSSWLGC